ncbi:magnesium and cobalt transport protein CorA [Siphonobacter sp. BAB-5385]|uniref:magnesium/cobalt transporter CorA n=1 Tax=Siphonobacter sp. BAB-5385 TaxID=1864822 RepID=UPI000B9E1231|nr:magnesium/cobalt transporter CorA [Siphonobacter sp. BAB-5385]OZI08299.1 magnesium and cobalt transport protein CorA [Siphonobacter sp. BAB-5385]
MSSRKHKIERKNLGTSPGTLQYIGLPLDNQIKITRIDFTLEGHQKKIVQNYSEASPSTTGITWLNIDGIHKPEVIAEIGRLYQLHPLMQEDILNTLQKPKFEFFGENTLFIVLKWLEYNPHTREVEPEHVALVLGPRWVLSFQEERSRDIFEVIRKRIEAGAGKTRQNGADYLLYALADVVVDQYFRVLDCVEENLDRLEEALFKNAEQKHLEEIYTVKRELGVMRKVVTPLREITLSLSREAPLNGQSLISANTEIYLRDLYDHINQVNETVELYRDQMTSLMDLYNSTISNRLNNVMKVLTIISVIFMPLTFVAGIYGMNFEYMPELHWRYGYPFAMGLMAVMVVIMLLWFRRKRWL